MKNILFNFCELVFILLTIPFFIIPFIIIYIVLLFSNNGNPIFWSQRIGLNNKIFLMPKFRTMKYNTPMVATHLLPKNNSYVTFLGKILRKTSLDEVPQIISIMKGDMKIVGPRPALYNQYDLIELRTKKNIHKIKPGITGLAQINGRDDLSIPEKVELDYKYYLNQSIYYDFIIIIKTFFKLFNFKQISH